MTRATFETWLQGTRLISADNGTWQVAVKSNYAKESLENRLLKVISQTVARLVNQSIDLQFVVVESLIAPADLLPDEVVLPAPPPPETEPPDHPDRGLAVDVRLLNRTGYHPLTHYYPRFIEPYLCLKWHTTGQKAYALWEKLTALDPQQYLHPDFCNWTRPILYRMQDISDKMARAQNQNLTGKYGYCARFGEAKKEGQPLTECCGQYQPDCEFRLGRYCRHWLSGILAYQLSRPAGRNQFYSTGSISHEMRSDSIRSEVEVILLPSAVLRQHLWPETDAQFCPRCLAETTYHRLAWLPQAVSVCLAHRCLLVKGCPRCGARLKIVDVVEGCCGQCDFDLRTSSTISVADDAFSLFSQDLIQVCLRLGLNTSVGIVERSVKLGLLANYPQSRRTPTTQRFKLASRDSVLALKQRWRYGIPLSDVARLLGVNQNVTKDLMRAGLIKAVSGSEIDGYKVWKIGSQSLAYFFKRLERRGVRYLYDQPVKIISLTRAAKAGVKTGLDTIFLIEQILAGGLRGYWPPEHRNLGRLSVSLEDLKAIQDALQGDQPQPVGDNKGTEVAPISPEVEGQSRKIRLTAPQLAQQLGISREHLWYWLKREIGTPAPEPENAENQT